MSNWNPRWIRLLDDLHPDYADERRFECLHRDRECEIGATIWSKRAPKDDEFARPRLVLIWHDCFEVLTCRLSRVGDGVWEGPGDLAHCLDPGGSYACTLRLSRIAQTPPHTSDER